MRGRMTMTTEILLPVALIVTGADPVIIDEDVVFLSVF
jgi:hypothetical protein